MKHKEEKKEQENNNSINIGKKDISKFLKNGEKREKKVNLIEITENSPKKENLSVIKNNHDNIDIKTNKIHNNNENNNSIFIFNKNDDDIDKNFNTDNNSCLSLIKIMEEDKKEDIKKFKNNKFKSLSNDKKTKAINNKNNIYLKKNKTPKNSRKSIINLYKKINIYDFDDKNNSNNEIIPYIENENTKIITTAKVRKLSISSENSNKNGIKSKNNNNYSPTRIDFILNLSIKNDIEKSINKIKLLSEQYIYKSEDKIKEIKDISNKNNNIIEIIENNNQYQHQNFLSKVCLDSIEELYEEENDSKSKSKINSNINKSNKTNKTYKTNKANITNRELNSYCLSEKNDSPNSCKNLNNYKIYSSNSKNSKNSNGKNNIINNTTYFSSKYTLGKNNIFDISSDESEKENNNNNYEDSKNKIINYIEGDKIYNSLDEQNNYDSNIYLRPIDTFINYNDYDYTNSFMNESDINKLFTSPNKKLISFIDNSSNINSNNKYIIYNQKMNNSAINNNRINKYLLNENDENDLNNNSSSNIFNKSKKGIINKQYYNRTYFKKSISKDFKNSKIKNLKQLISPENLNKYYSSTLNSIINNNINNNKPNKSNIDFIKISIKSFSNDNSICKRLKYNKTIGFFNNIDLINHIKNQRYIKYFSENIAYIKKIKIDLNYLNIEFIDKKRKLINNNNSLTLLNSTNSKIHSNKREEYNDNTFYSTIDKKNINNNRSIESKDYNKINNNIIYKFYNLKSEKISKIPIRINKFNLKEKSNNINYNDNITTKKNLNKINFNNNNYLLNKIDSINNKNDNKIKNRLINSFENDDIFELDNKIKNNKIKIKKCNSLNITDIDKNKNTNELELTNKKVKKNKLYISIESYEELLKILITKTYDIKNKLLSDKNNNNSNSSLIIKENIIENNNKKDIDNIIISFENQLNLLKNNYLCLLIKKHYLKKKSDKEKLIKKVNIQNKRDLFNQSYLNIIDILKEKLKFENIEINKFYFDKVINILEKYKTISKLDIKYTKKIFKENNDITPYNLDIKMNNKKNKFHNVFGKLVNNDSNNKNIFYSTWIILPLLYGINYLICFYNKNQSWN